MSGGNGGANPGNPTPAAGGAGFTGQAGVAGNAGGDPGGGGGGGGAGGGAYMISGGAGGTAGSPNGANGSLSLDAQLAQYHLVDGTTSLAEIAYAFFTGKTPTAAGLNYLVHSAANPNDLNDAYYQGFNTDNRYINFAVNLGTGGGAGAAAFNAAYGSLSLTDAATKAYQAVFGVAPASGKIAAILNELVPNGLGGTETRAQYLADVSGGATNAQKAAVVGYFLADSLREGGVYASADFHFLADLAHGRASFNIDLLAAYGPAPALVGAALADPTVPH